MYLIYLTALPDEGDDHRHEMPEVDIQPIMLALTNPSREVILRHPDTRVKGKAGMPSECEGVERIYGSLKECKSTDKEKSGLESSVESGEAMMAVALATIFFGAGNEVPNRVDYVQHIRNRSRLADKLVVVGYTDRECSMADSEVLALKRARKVRETLTEGGLDIPVSVVSRPLCNFPERDNYARRVEVTALYGCGSGDTQTKASKGEPVVTMMTHGTVQ